MSVKLPAKFHSRVYIVTAHLQSGAPFDADAFASAFTGAEHINLHCLDSVTAHPIPGWNTLRFWIIAPERLGAAGEGLAAVLDQLDRPVHAATLEYAGDPDGDPIDSAPLYCRRRTVGCRSIHHRGQCSDGGKP